MSCFWYFGLRTLKNRLYILISDLLKIRNVTKLKIHLGAKNHSESDLFRKLWKFLTILTILAKQKQIYITDGILWFLEYVTVFVGWPTYSDFRPRFWPVQLSKSTILVSKTRRLINPVFPTKNARIWPEGVQIEMTTTRVNIKNDPSNDFLIKSAGFQTLFDVISLDVMNVLKSYFSITKFLTTYANLKAWFETYEKFISRIIVS